MESSTLKFQHLAHLDEAVQRRLLITYLRAQGMTLGEARAAMELIQKVDNSTWKIPAPTATIDLQQAGFDRWITTSLNPRIFAETLYDDIYDNVHRLPWNDLEFCLKRLSGDVFRELHVFYSRRFVGREPLDEEWPWILQRFGINSAPLIDRLLCSATTIAVCWGTTIATVVNSLWELNPDGQCNSGATKVVLPTAGQPLSQEYQHLDSTSIARRLSHYLNGPTTKVLSLDNVPPIIPPAFRGDVKVREFITGLSAHRTIFGTGPDDDQAALNGVDTILASCGAFHRWQMFTAEWLHGKVDASKVAIGDIGGALVPKSTVDERDFSEVADLWLGIKMEHFATAAVKSPGVILCAVGANKAHIVLELLKRQLVTILVTDKSLVQALTGECIRLGLLPVISP